MSLRPHAYGEQDYCACRHLVDAHDAEGCMAVVIDGCECKRTGDQLRAEKRHLKAVAAQHPDGQHPQ